ncbi:urease accessory UreF family protein [Tsukamurella sp. 8F]|uniref:urease accessory protein UreF n=1 Tax=unclassified Tsukamurella TaxID=2633480 RepID=UPI0023B98620|nr:MULTISPECIES: urease accessory UreF family protein [unclassified Tsukamurella]MDF0529095.1 urease accessory UreF family protein [Tsukamurella sp. 8J]MDF0589018.1 urease accessory UreF family protein [Tsukamurella sp. 8F]
MRLAGLLTLADSRLPVGGHVHSGGMEEAIVSGLVRDVPGVGAYLERRVRTVGLVTGSIAAAVCAGRLTPTRADIETSARTPSPAAREASRIQGRGYLRFGRRAWPDEDLGWAERPHAATVLGVVARLAGVSPNGAALVAGYTAMTGAATAAQRLLALDPADVAVLTMKLATECEIVAASAVTGLADLSDPLQDVLAERHLLRDNPLFVS